MTVGRSWTYQITTPLQAYVESVTVSRSISVGSCLGYELVGVHGVSRLAWSGDRLLASTTANARFSPPIPLLIGNRKHAQWRGQVGWMGSTVNATARIEQQVTGGKVNGRVGSSVKSLVRLMLPNHSVTLTSWFQPGVGLVEQTQDTDTNQQVKIEMLR